MHTPVETCKSTCESTGKAVVKFAQDTLFMIAFIGEMTKALGGAIIRPDRIRWRETRYYMQLCGSQSLPIVFLLCYLMGVIIGLQAAIQLEKFGGAIFIADLIGFSTLKELGPLMVAMIATGRAGASFAAEIGSMKAAEEIDAMQTMGFAPHRFLVVPKLLALLIVIPLLAVFGDLAGILGGMTVGKVYLELPVQSYVSRSLEVLYPMALIEGMVKSVVYAFLISAVGCMRGFQADRDAQGVGRSTTSAVVSGIFLVVIANVIMTLLFTILKV
jgi:phospholipid/cholesterol/gamma-HCH transport system permease protein